MVTVPCFLALDHLGDHLGTVLLRHYRESGERGFKHVVQPLVSAPLLQSLVLFPREAGTEPSPRSLSVRLSGAWCHNSTHGYYSTSGGVLRSLANRFLSIDFSYASSGEIHFFVRRSWIASSKRLHADVLAGLHLRGD